MRCPKCDNDLFPGQFRCERCGEIVKDIKEEPKNKVKENEEHGK